MAKLLKFLMLLAGSKTYSVSELAKRFALSDRTVHRYIAAIKQAGFAVIGKDKHYRVAIDNAQGRHLQKLFYFTDEEVYLLSKTLSFFGKSSVVQQRLLRKLHALYDLAYITELEKTAQFEIIDQLRQGMNQQQQVILKNYRSSHSQSISDRVVEAFDFTNAYSGVWCFDVNDGRCKQFKIARIGSVQAGGQPWQHQAKHQLPFEDVFHMSAPEPVTTVRLRLSLKAYNLLVEEHPLAEEMIKLVEGAYEANIPVANFNGIGRFVWGLPGEIKVLAPDEFKIFLERK